MSAKPTPDEKSTMFSGNSSALLWRRKYKPMIARKFAKTDLISRRSFCPWSAQSRCRYPDRLRRAVSSTASFRSCFL